MRRNTKTMYEWRKAYRDKEELMLERGFPEVSPHEFYRDLFPEGSLQSAEHDGKGKLNSVLVSILLIAIGVVMLIVAIIFYFLKKK